MSKADLIEADWHLRGSFCCARQRGLSSDASTVMENNERMSFVTPRLAAWDAFESHVLYYSCIQRPRAVVDGRRKWIKKE